jgi:glycine/D-amino acid oxidase-like deaminating enzyme
MSGRRAVIVGAGITGVLTGLSLRKAGWDVTVLEALHPGAGSSSRTAAGIRQQFSTEATVRGMRYALHAYQELPAELGLNEAIVVQNGYLFLVAGDDAWAAAQARVGMQQRTGLVEAEALAADEVGRRFPWVDAARIHGATWCPTDGFLHPALIYGEGARALRERGGQLVQHAPVDGAAHDGRGALTALRTPKGAFEADLFVDATNAWSPRTAAAIGATPLPIAPLKRYLWFVRRAEEAMTAPVMAAMPLVIGPGGVYVRPENADLLLMGFAHAAEPEPAFTHDDQDRVEPAFDPDHGLDSRAYAAWAEIADVLPAVGAFDGIGATTSGYYGTTPDHNPFLGYDPAVPNLIRLVGFSGHGAMFGPFTAAVAAALAEAGRDVAAIELPTGRTELDGFRIGRAFEVHEALVI